VNSLIKAGRITIISHRRHTIIIYRRSRHFYDTPHSYSYFDNYDHCIIVIMIIIIIIIIIIVIDYRITKSYVPDFLSM